MLEAHGVAPEVIDDAEAAGTSELLAIDAVVLPGKVKLNVDELAAKVGVDVQVVKAFWRALGFVDIVDDERMFSKHDVSILKSLVAVTREGHLDPDIALQVARVIGMSVANVATAVVDASATRSEERRNTASVATFDADADTTTPGEAESLAVRSGAVLPFMSDVIDYSFRRHLRAAARRRVVLASSPGGETQVVGFADLVRFTELSLHLDDRELAELIGRFDSLVHDVVIGHGGRIVKMIGDAAMFSVVDPRSGALIALDLTDAVSDDPVLSGLRVGMASGPTLARDGDLYGPVVNAASRLASIGRAGAINIDQSLRNELADDRRFALRSLGQRKLRHIGDVRVYRLRRGEMNRHPSAHPEH